MKEKVTLPEWLLDLIGAYGSACLAKVNEVDRIAAWSAVIVGIHRYVDQREPLGGKWDDYDARGHASRYP